MGTVCVSVVATQNFYTIDRLLADAGHPRFSEVVEQVGDVEARDFLRYLSSELNRLFFQYWNYAQFLIGGVAIWLVLRLPDSARLKWPLGVMLAILVVLTFVVPPRSSRLVGVWISCHETRPRRAWPHSASSTPRIRASR